MRTRTARRPEQQTKLPEWRRICHRYVGDSQVSICGLATRKPGQDHVEADCRARGHGVCVVCEELLENERRAE